MVKIFVGRIPQPIGKDKLQDLFEKYGHVTECEIIKDYGFIHLDCNDEGAAAIQALNNLQIEGGTLTVEKSHGRPARKREDSRQGGGGGGGRGGGGGGPGRRDSGGRGDDRRGGGGRGYDRARSPVDRRRDDYGGRGGDDRYGGGDRSRAYPATMGRNDPVSVYGDRGGGGGGRYGGSSMLPSAIPYYDSRSAPAPASYGGNGYDSYSRRSPPQAAPPRYGASYGGGSNSYGGAPSYGGGAGGGSSGSYDNYDRYSGSYGRSDSSSRRYPEHSGSAVPAAGVTRRY